MTVHVFKPEVFDQYIARKQVEYRTALAALIKERAAAMSVRDDATIKAAKETAVYSSAVETAKSTISEIEGVTSEISDERAQPEPNETHIQESRASSVEFENLGNRALALAQDAGVKGKVASAARDAAQAIVDDCDARTKALDNDFFSEQDLALLPALASSKTNADGETLLSYSGDDVLLFAQASRSVGSGDEHYTWLLHNPESGLMLNNDNAMEPADRAALITGK